MWIRFLTDDTAYVPMQWAWMDPPLVALSVAVAIMTAMLALHLAGLAQQAAKRWTGQLLKAAGAVMLGGGVWAMHFIGMLAFTPCATSDFSTLHRALSALPSMAAA